ncbi:MAG TPA: ABC transporter substrate-binding protein [bacterium]|nr:ABC transporter substrate-binding protein [bacterium]
MNDNRITVTLASGLYDITRPLVEGLVGVDGVRLNVLSKFESVDEIFRRMLNLEFDVSELSLSHYLIGRQLGKPLVALPIFLNRVFPQGNLYCNVDAGIREPSDLKGRKVGLPEYQVTRALWARGILEDLYGVRKEEIRWVTERSERVDLKPPPNVSVERIPPGETVSQMLIDGKIDAAMYWWKPQSEKVRYLFEDPVAEAVSYYKKTKIFPIMHTVAMRRDLYERHPWMARSILNAYEESKRICFQWRNHYSGGTLPWLGSVIARQNEILGDDPFPFNLESNLHNIETLARYSANEGLIKPVQDLPSLFVARD